MSKDSSEQTYAKFREKLDSLKDENRQRIIEVMEDIKRTDTKFKKQDSKIRKFKRRTKTQEQETSHKFVEDENFPIDGDLERGSRIYMKHCSGCHSLEANSRMIKSTGPALGLLIGRKIGGDYFYPSYSESVTKNNFFWSKNQLMGFLNGPQEILKGTQCRFPGLKETDDKVDLVSFLSRYSRELWKFMRMRAEERVGKEYLEKYLESKKLSNNEK